MRYALTSLISAFVLIAAPAMAQKTATQFYMDYQAAFAKAKTIDEILPFMDKETVEQVKATPAAERVKMFGMIKMMNAYTNLKVVKETKTPTGYSLDVTATDSDKKPAKGSIEIVNEGGAMKLKGESWITQSI